MQAEATITAGAPTAHDRMTAERAELGAALDTARAADCRRRRARRRRRRARPMRRGAGRPGARGGESGRLDDLERGAQAAAIEASRHEEALAAFSRERELAIRCRSRARDGGHREDDLDEATPLLQALPARSWRPS